MGGCQGGAVVEVDVFLKRSDQLDIRGITRSLDSKAREDEPQNKVNALEKIYPNGIPVESSYDFKELPLHPAMVITPYVFKDDRGEFIEVFNQVQFKQRLGIDFKQDCTSVSCKDSLRGLHGDFRTWKLIHCPKGSVLACIIDLNPGSPTYFQSTQVLINDKNRAMLLVPPGFGNSYFVLEEGTVYCYKKSTYFVPCAEFTLHYTCAQWPDWISPTILSKRDLHAPRNRDEFESAMKERNDLENNPFLLL